jgi:Fe-Mn family superoxide dismutase
MFKLPELDYSYDSLEPFIDRETMEIHHSRHHATYIKNLNEALKNFKVKNTSIEELIKNLHDVPSEIFWDVKNNGGGHVNHTMFFKMMSPKGMRAPAGRLLEKINASFGSFEEFKDKFKKSAMSRFGSGWSWLLVDKYNKLFIKSSLNQDCPLSEGKDVLLGLDLWEHAYYLNYRNNRSEYVDKWWNVVNWEYVMERFEKIDV